MKLQDFIKSALVEIISGVEQAKIETSETSAHIGPELKIDNGNAVGGSIVKTSCGSSASVVSFDIAVTIEKGEGASANIGVIGTILKLGADVHSSKSNNIVSRLSFSVPVKLP